MTADQTVRANRTKYRDAGYTIQAQPPRMMRRRIRERLRIMVVDAVSYEPVSTLPEGSLQGATGLSRFPLVVPDY